MSLKSARLPSLRDKLEAEVERIEEKVEKEIEKEEKTAKVVRISKKNSK